ncbi:ABC transporter ATP-binding protein [Methanofollis aquaemaris]|uniref:ABC transporter ATP-binding protein n=1 Tax=Methanofollis aquaemaris TaxID=126734 RepID=A0A8A3S474_9EURY|nr:ABC transporter ATP-binding protein [Methanofollis aquaemaris]QSZ66862.1 ABC transporter ATP-binding protein [Methanofollis aquaemaris]
MIVVADLARTYLMGKVAVHALRGVSFTIGSGEFVGIMGPSGSGKSTLLHALGLLDRPTAGTIEIDGTDVLALSERQKTRFRLHRLGYVFQDYALMPELTVEENVFLPALVGGMQKEEAIRISGEILAEVGLLERRAHLQGELSGGEQQRVAIARALMNNPSILFADEPCANLDTTTSKTILDLFERLNEERGQTIVMVTHEDWHIDYFCRVIYLRDGLIERTEECEKGRRRRNSL